MTRERVKKLRLWLNENNYDAIIIPTNDPHFSEYVAPFWKSREWISGFTGSAGTVVITAKEALLWCDSRYFVQAELELDLSIFSIQKIGMPEVPTINYWLATNIENGGKVAVCGKLISISTFMAMERELPNQTVVSVDDPFIVLWENRPSMPNAAVTMLNENCVGETVASKLERVGDILKLDDSRVYITSLLDEIAWLLNIRGGDVAYNPVVVGYVVVSRGGVVLFADNGKFSEQDIFELRAINVEVKSYERFEAYLSALKGKSVIVNRDKFDIYHYNALLAASVNVEFESTSFGVISSLKAVKNQEELHGIHRAMISDGIALTKFFMWLEDAVEKREHITEYDISKKLTHFRSLCSDYKGDSFSTIVGYKSNGAIVHYSPTEESAAKVEPEGFLLIDSGGQYSGGTTDITRTVHLSMPTEQEKRDYTLVLKGNISLSMAVFPVGTCGYQLDILARQYLLQQGLNYMHGTGHGVGHYLNVHEGPQSIRMDYNPTPFVAGMVTSNEPGLYRKGEYGIRLENIIECAHFAKNEFGDFHRFITITLFPFDLKCINVGMLSCEERHWLNRYHSKVFDKLSQFLSSDERIWLSNNTKAI